MSNLIEMATELGKAIKEDEKFKAYESAKSAHDADAQLQLDIAAFTKKRNELMPLMQAEKKDDDKIREVQQELEKMYAAIMDNENMKKFMQASTEMEQLVNSIYSILNFYISGQQQGGCSGSCSSCGGSCGN